MVVRTNKELSPDKANPYASLTQTQTDMAVVSFGRIGRQPAPDPHFVIDVSEWRDPLGSKTLKNLYTDGRAGEVQDFVREDPKYQAAANAALMITYTNLISNKTTPKPWISIGVRDHHGTWTAPAMTELLAEEINRKLGIKVFVRHVELNKLAYFSWNSKKPEESGIVCVGSPRVVSEVKL